MSRNTLGSFAVTLIILLGLDKVIGQASVGPDTLGVVPASKDEMSVLIARLKTMYPALREDFFSSKLRHGTSPVERHTAYQQRSNPGFPAPPDADPGKIRRYPGRLTQSDSVIVDWISIHDEPNMSSRDWVSAMAVDAAGNVYVTGGTDSTLSFIDFMTRKYDPGGSLLWSRRWTSSVANYDVPMAIAVDSAGNAYVTGTSYNKTSFYDIVTIKYDANGDEAWVRQLNGPGNYHDFPSAIVADSVGNVYVGGFSYGVSTGDYLTVKYTTDGTVEWERRYNGIADEFSGVNAMAIDHAGNIVVTGMTNNVIAEGDILTMKYTPDGVELWSALIDGRYHGQENALAIAVDGQDNIAVAGYSTRPHVIDEDFLTAMYSAEGTFRWWAFYDSIGQFDIANSVAFDDSGGLYVGGTSSSSYSPFRNDFFLMKYDTTGTELWRRREIYPAGSSTVMQLALDHTGSLVVLATERLFKFSSAGSIIMDLWYSPSGGTTMRLDGHDNIYIAGVASGTPTEADFLVSKYDSGGIRNWYRTFNGSGHGTRYIDAVRVDREGFSYLLTTGTVQNDTGGQVLSGFLLKYDPAGNLLWEKITPELRNGNIAIDSNGNLYILHPTNIISKYTSNGDVLWTQDYTPPDGYFMSTLLLGLDAQANVYIAATRRRGADGSFDIVKYSSDGIQRWVAEHDFFIGETVENITDLAVHANGTCAVTGYGGGNSLTVVFNADGTLRWADVDLPLARCIAIDQSENVYVAGDGVVLRYLANGSKVFNAPIGGRDIAADNDGNIYAATNEGIIKYDPVGAEQWRFNPPSDLFELALDQCGYVYAAGGYFPELYSEQSRLTAFKVSSDGELEWEAEYAPTNQNFGWGSLHLTNHGEVFIGGSIYLGDGSFEAEFLLRLHQTSTFASSTDSVAMGEVSLSCTGEDTLHIYSSICISPDVFSISGTDSIFSIVPSDLSLSPSKDHIFMVQFTPLNPGFRENSFTVSNSINGQTLPVTLRGTGVEDSLAFSPANFIVFDSTVVGCSDLKSVQIHNPRCDTVHLHVIVSGFDFTLPTPDPVIPPLDSFQLWVRFFPGGVGDKSNYLLVTMEENATPSILGMSGYAVGVGTEVAFADSFEAGWQLISLPVTQVCDAIFPGAYIYSGSYQRRDTLHPGSGYWFKIDQPRLMFAGEPILTLSQPVTDRWNIIGSISGDIPVDGITSTPPGIILTPFYTFTSSGYEEADSIRPRHGYWVKVSQDGLLHLQLGAPAQPKVKNHPEQVKSSLRFTDARGLSRVLYLSTQAEDGSNEWYELPPQPPEGAFDIRFSSGRNLELLTTGSPKDYPIQITGATYPITIHWDMHSSPTPVLSLGPEEIPMAGTGDAEIPNEGVSVRIKTSGIKEVPTDYVLGQNYPNPFNPSTTVTFELPERGRVRLQVFDVLGRAVETIVDQEMEAGIYRRDWNAAGRPSGAYHILLSVTESGAGGRTFSSSIRALLMK